MASQIAFRVTVTSADGTATEGAYSEADALGTLRTAVQRGYRVEATRQGGAVIVRDVPGGGLFAVKPHTVTLEPSRPAGTVTATMRSDLGIIGRRGSRSLTAHYRPGIGRIDAGLNSIPPAAARRLIDRGLITVTGDTVTVSLSARLAMLAQDHRTETSEPRGYHREAGVIGPWRKGGCVYDRLSVAHCACRWSYPAEDRDDARRRAHAHRQEVTAAMVRSLAAQALAGRPVLAGT